MTGSIDNKWKEAIKDAALGLPLEERQQLYGRRHDGKSAVALAHEMKRCQDTIEWLKTITVCLNAEYDILRTGQIPTAMEREGIDSPFNVDGVGRVTLTADAYVTIAGPKDQLFDWLKRNKYGSLISADINSSTLKAFVKGRLAEGKKLPMELLKITPFTRASITKTKGK